MFATVKAMDEEVVVAGVLFLLVGRVVVGRSMLSGIQFLVVYSLWRRINTDSREKVVDRTTAE